MHPVIRDVAAALGDKAKVIKIDVDKNKELADALRIKGVPTLMMYKEGQMVWRQSGS
jgi:thioredoxin 1